MIVFLLAGALLTPVASSSGRAGSILEANRSVMERVADTTLARQRRSPAVRLKYAYSGQGMKGFLDEIIDLQRPAFLITRYVGNFVEQDGYDGRTAWERERSGSVTPQTGGDMHALAVSEAYRAANLWWRPDRGGATISYAGQRQDGASSADALKITPMGGVAFEAWFDQRTHLLIRVDEPREGIETTIRYSDYRLAGGAMHAGRVSVGNGDAADGEVQMLKLARFLPSIPDACCSAPVWTALDTEFTDGSDAATVPFEIVNGEIYVNVRIDGKGPYPFVVDTGGVNIITPSTARAAGAIAVGTLTMRGGGAGTDVGGIAMVDRLSIGTIVLRNQPMRVLSISENGIEQGGMIGFETLRRFVTRIDYGQRKIEFIKPDAFDPRDAGTPVPITFYGNLTIAKGSYDGIPGDFTIDTGNPGSIFLSSPFSKEHSLQSRASGGIRTIAGVGIGGPSYGVVFRGGTLKLGEVAVARPIVLISTDTAGAMADPALAGNIGAGVLRRFIITLDYAHSLLYLKPITPRPSNLDNYDRSGMRVSKSANDVTIGEVTPQSPAAFAGVLKGDVLEFIDDKAVSELTIDDIKSLLRDQSPGTELNLSLRRNGKPLQAALTLRDLLPPR